MQYAKRKDVILHKINFVFKSGTLDTRANSMTTMADKMDMSLEDIIKLNKMQQGRRDRPDSRVKRGTGPKRYRPAFTMVEGTGWHHTADQNNFQTSGSMTYSLEASGVKTTWILVGSCSCQICTSECQMLIFSYSLLNLER